jgi:hypothetical protein
MPEELVRNKISQLGTNLENKKTGVTIRLETCEGSQYTTKREYNQMSCNRGGYIWSIIRTYQICGLGDGGPEDWGSR